MAQLDKIEPCLEVLKLEEGVWEVSYLLANESLFIIPGVGFEPNSSIFWFQAGSYPGQGGLPSDVRLFELDTDTNEVFPSMRLPGGFARALGIAGAECRGGT